MTDRRETILNVEREPETRVYTDGGSGYGLLAGIVIALLVIGVFALIYFRPAETVVAPSTPAIEAPAPTMPAPAPEPAAPAAPEAPAPASP